MVTRAEFKSSKLSFRKLNLAGMMSFRSKVREEGGAAEGAIQGQV